ncbi:AfsR/SARP family transcriptional regulator [Actinosynnema sp. NPDC091369]
MDIGLLGEVAVSVDGHALDVGPDRQRCVLAALAVDVGRVVSVDRLIERVWGESPPSRARATLLSYLSRLRRVLVAVHRRPGGYVLEVDPSSVDLHRFRALRERARAGDDAAAAGLLGEALALWRGEALTGLRGDWAAAERGRLDQERLDAERDLVDVRLRLGHGEGLVSLLATRADEWPLDERVAGQYMLALHRAGRTADALAHYRQVRDRLVAELGADPGAALQDLHRQVLAADPALTARTGGPAVTPRQLPASPASFIGRRDGLDRLDAAVGGAAVAGQPDGRRHPATADTAGTVAITAIAGPGGIGKTWLALHWAHRHAERFPDGQLFVDLRGFSPDSAPMAPEVAIRGFLDALGVEPARVPVAPHAQAALFRSLVADKRMLLVLDNAADTAQVTPLLPGGECTVVVTSRTQLPGLITTHGAHHVQLDVLTDVEAHALLADRLGHDRVTAEPAAVEGLIRSCGGFPLALSIVAGHAATRPRLPLAALVAELRDLGLDALDDVDPAASLPAVLSWSYRALSPEQATVFGLLGIAPGPDISLPAAVSLTGRPRAVLRELERASLITQDTADRWRMHDLIRAYAATTVEGRADEALTRVLDFYLHTAHAAERLQAPHFQPLDLDPPAPGVRPHPLADEGAAVAWLDAEHANLLASQQAAAAAHRYDTVWRLAWTLTNYHQRRGRAHDQLTVWRAALRAADHLADPTTRMVAHRRVGRAHTRLGRHEEATEHLRHALSLAERHGDPEQQGHTHHELTWAFIQRGDERQALTHAERALVLYRTFDQPVWEALALNLVGWCAARLGDYDTARARCQAALALYRDHDSPNGEADVLDSLGYIDHHTGDHRRAVDHYRRALALRNATGNTASAADTLDHVGHPHVALGRTDQARAAWYEALELYRQQGRDTDAQRVQEQLDALGSRADLRIG